MGTLREILNRLLVAERLFHAVVIWTSISMMTAVVTNNQWAAYAMGGGLAFFTAMTLAVGLYLIVGAMMEHLSRSLSSITHKPTQVQKHQLGTALLSPVWSGTVVRSDSLDR